MDAQSLFGHSMSPLSTRILWTGSLRALLSNCKYLNLSFIFMHSDLSFHSEPSAIRHVDFSEILTVLLCIYAF